MLQKLSEGINGWVSTLIIVAVSVSFLIFGISYYLTSHSGANAVVAKVGKTAITNQQLQTALRREQFIREKEQGALNAKQLNFLKQMVLGALVQQAVNKAALDGLGLVVSPQAIETTIRSLPAFKRNGQYDSELLKRYLSSYGMSLEEFMQQFSHQIREQQLKLGLVLSASALPSNVDAMRNWADQTRRFRYVDISPQPFLSNLSVTAKQLDAYYQSHQKDFEIPDRVKVSYLQLDPQQVAKNIAVSTQQVKQYYQQHRNQFRQAATYRYASIVLLGAASKDGSGFDKISASIEQVLKSGKTVSQVAKRFGGSVQSMKADQLNPEMLALLQQMQPGQQLTNQPLKAGHVWLQLISVQAGAVKSLVSVKKQIKARMVAEQAQKKMAALTEQLSDLTYTESTSLQPAAQKLGLKVQQSDWLTQTGKHGGVFADKRALNAAFSDDVLKQGDNSLPVSLADGSVVVLRAQTFQKAQTKPLKAVKKQVTQAVKQQAAELKAALVAQQLEDALNNKQSVQKLVKQYRLRWHQLKAAKRSDSHVPAVVLHAAFALEKAPAATSVTQVGGVSSVVQLQSIILPKQKLSAKHKQELADSVQALFAKIESAAVLEAAEKSVKIKHYAANS